MNEVITLASAYAERRGTSAIGEDCCTGSWDITFEAPVISEKDGADVCAETDTCAKTIRINTQQSIPMQLDALIHESIHAAECDMSDMVLLSEDFVSAIARRITRNLLATGAVKMSEDDEADHCEMMGIRRRWQETRDLERAEVAALEPRADDGRMRVGLIVAIADNGVIGLDGGMPWPRLREDLKRFRATTMGHAVIVGRKTFESMPTLDGRDVIVYTRSAPDGRRIVSTDGEPPTRRVPGIVHALSAARKMGHKQAWICGGLSAYRSRAAAECVDEVRITRIGGVYEGDRWLDMDPRAQGLTQCLRRDVSEDGVGVELEVWMRPHAPYLGPALLPEDREMEE